MVDIAAAGGVRFARALSAKTINSDNFINRSGTMGYDFAWLGIKWNYAAVSEEKSKKSRTRIPSVMEKDSIDSKEGAFNPRSMRFRKSTEMFIISANCS
jgi:hypothetical protein